MLFVMAGGLPGFSMLPLVSFHNRCILFVNLREYIKDISILQHTFLLLNFSKFIVVTFLVCAYPANPKDAAIFILLSKLSLVLV